MFLKKISILFLLCIISINSKKTLVLLDDWLSVETNSVFWNQISQMGYELIFKIASDKDIQLTNFGEYIYFLKLYYHLF